MQHVCCALLDRSYSGIRCPLSVVCASVSSVSVLHDGETFSRFEIVCAVKMIIMHKVLGFAGKRFSGNDTTMRWFLSVSHMFVDIQRGQTELA